jgi:hypothetical protein
VHNHIRAIRDGILSVIAPGCLITYKVPEIQEDHTKYQLVILKLLAKFRKTQGVFTLFIAHISSKKAM